MVYGCENGIPVGLVTGFVSAFKSFVTSNRVVRPYPMRNQSDGLQPKSDGLLGPASSGKGLQYKEGRRER